MTETSRRDDYAGWCLCPAPKSAGTGAKYILHEKEYITQTLRSFQSGGALHSNGKTVQL